MPKQLPQVWYEAGLQFECQQCSRCCVNHSDYTYVYLSEADLQRLVEHFELKREQFLQRYTEELETGHIVLRSTGDACIFLEDRACGVYPARPVQCATWPFWRETMKREVWHQEVAPLCPGVGLGRRHSRSEIDAQIALTDDNDHPA